MGVGNYSNIEFARIQIREFICLFTPLANSSSCFWGKGVEAQPPCYDFQLQLKS